MVIILVIFVFVKSQSQSPPPPGLLISLSFFYSRFRSRFCSNGTTGTRSGNKDEDTTGTPCEEGEGSDYKIRGGRRYVVVR